MANPKLLFDLFHEHGVKFVVIDRVAAALNGIPVMAKSIAVCPLDSPQNNTNIARALSEIHPRAILDSGSAVEMHIDEGFLRYQRRDLGIGKGVSFLTDYGTVELVYTPPGMERDPDPYATLSGDAKTVTMRNTRKR